MSRIEGACIEAGPITEVRCKGYLAPFYKRSFVILVGGETTPKAVFRNGLPVQDTSNCAFYLGPGGMRMFVDHGDVSDTQGAVPVFGFDFEPAE